MYLFTRNLNTPSEQGESQQMAYMFNDIGTGSYNLPANMTIDHFFIVFVPILSIKVVLTFKLCVLNISDFDLSDIIFVVGSRSQK